MNDMAGDVTMVQDSPVAADKVAKPVNPKSPHQRLDGLTFATTHLKPVLAALAKQSHPVLQIRHLQSLADKKSLDSSSIIRIFRYGDNPRSGGLKCVTVENGKLVFTGVAQDLATLAGLDPHVAFADYLATYFPNNTQPTTISEHALASPSAKQPQALTLPVLALDDVKFPAPPRPSTSSLPHGQPATRRLTPAEVIAAAYRKNAIAAQDTFGTGADERTNKDKTKPEQPIKVPTFNASVFTATKPFSILLIEFSANAWGPKQDNGREAPPGFARQTFHPDEFQAALEYRTGLNALSPERKALAIATMARYVDLYKGTASPFDSNGHLTTDAQVLITALSIKTARLEDMFPKELDGKMIYTDALRGLAGKQRSDQQKSIAGQMRKTKIFTIAELEAALGYELDSKKQKDLIVLLRDTDRDVLEKPGNQWAVQILDSAFTQGLAAMRPITKRQVGPNKEPSGAH